MDDTQSVTLGTIGNGAVTWTSALIAIFNLAASLKHQKLIEAPMLILIDEIGADIHYNVMLDILVFTKSKAY